MYKDLKISNENNLKWEKEFAKSRLDNDFEYEKRETSLLFDKATQVLDTFEEKSCVNTWLTRFICTFMIMKETRETIDDHESAMKARHAQLLKRLLARDRR